MLRNIAPAGLWHNWLHGQTAVNKRGINRSCSTGSFLHGWTWQSTVPASNNNSSFAKFWQSAFVHVGDKQPHLVRTNLAPRDLQNGLRWKVVVPHTGKTYAIASDWGWCWQRAKACYDSHSPEVQSLNTHQVTRVFRRDLKGKAIRKIGRASCRERVLVAV